MTSSFAKTTLRAAVIVFPGSNGDRDLFETLERAGFSPFYHPSSEPLGGDVSLIGLPGGFSYGDYWRAGMLASQAPAVRSLPDAKTRGALIIGICNGFQILVEARLLPGVLTYNDPPGFRHRWLDVEIQPSARGPWFEGISTGTRWHLPMAHGEGNYFHPDGARAIQNAVPISYCKNPNGSLANAAALLDESGQILGIMPHPERAADPTLGRADGLALFRAAFRWLSTHPPKILSGTTTATLLEQTPTQPPPPTTTDGSLKLSDTTAKQLAKALGLDAAEYQHFVDALGRLPTRAELSMAAGMWSEHCSYKSTRPLLGTLPRSAPYVLAGPGSHAGVVDVGADWAVAFKIESHNHPSAVEPYQGAATGVGGILRDIIAQGARPCAVMDSLCFGLPSTDKTRQLQAGVVAGIAGYGNAIGIPNVGGLTVYDSRYEGNPLVNALAAGLVKKDALRTAAAQGEGNAVMYVGAPTGRDGILGAAFASEELGKDQIEDRAHVQVGDPYSGKKLMEACLAFTPDMGMVACQDMGACGITCAITEMAAAGNVGMDILLDEVPLREAHMPAHEILLSESQERFLFVVDRQKEDAALQHFKKHGVSASIIGRVTNGSSVVVKHVGKIVAEVPAPLIAGGTPLKQWKGIQALPSVEVVVPKTHPKPAELLLQLLNMPGLSDATPLVNHYDQTVGNRTVLGPSTADAAVLKLPDTQQGFALCITGYGPACAVDPYLGAQAALAEGLRRLACVGSEMLAITDGLNMGSPSDPVEYFKLQRVIEGLGDGLRSLGLPVTGGNVSLYNESPLGAIPPTPMIGSLGKVADIQKCPRYRADAGDSLILLGDLKAQPSFGFFSQLIGAQGLVPHVNLQAERALAKTLLQLRDKIKGAASVRLGGAVVALAKFCLRTGLGARLDLPFTDDHSWRLFGEPAAAAWICCSSDSTEYITKKALEAGVPCVVAGTMQGHTLSIRGFFDSSLDDLQRAFLTRHGLA